MINCLQSFPISHRNSAAAVANLLKKTGCHEVIVGGGSAVTSLLAEAEAELKISNHTINVIELPPVEALYPHLCANDNTSVAKPVPSYPHPKNAESLDAIRFYIHSSGTTSLPKPIPIDERYLHYFKSSNCEFQHVVCLTQDLTLSFPDTSVISEEGKSKLHGAIAAPPFHVMGIIAHLLVPLFTGASILLWDITPVGTSVPVPTPENTIQSLKSSGCNSTMVVPSFLVAWARDEEAVQYLKQMNYVVRCVFFSLPPTRW